jgi:hypothetical protein
MIRNGTSWERAVIDRHYCGEQPGLCPASPHNRPRNITHRMLLATYSAENPPVRFDVASAPTSLALTDSKPGSWTTIWRTTGRRRAYASRPRRCSMVVRLTHPRPLQVGVGTFPVAEHRGWPYTYRLRREIYKPNMALGNPGSWLATTGSGYACQADNHDDVLPDYRSFAPAPNTE